LDVRASRFHNYPPHWNGAPNQELLVIRRNHHTGEISPDPLRWGLIPHFCEDPKAGGKPLHLCPNCDADVIAAYARSTAKRFRSASEQ
jgi:putative SOS response-associated peptidase YedK